MHQDPPEQEKKGYDVWTKEDVIPAPKDLPPPATLLYGKRVPARVPSTMTSTKNLLRPREDALTMTVAEGGQSYNPSLEDWEELIYRTAKEEQTRLAKIAQKEWVPQPVEEETPLAKSDDEESEPTENFLGKPVQVKRKTRAQRNKEARQAEMVIYFHSRIDQ